MNRWLAPLALASLLVVGAADASEPTADAKDTTSPKRPLPAYDGRAPAPTPVADTLLWIPRIVLAPAYLVSEFVIRRPLSIIIPAAEKVDLFTKVYNFFVFGKDHKAGIIPIGYVEFDVKPSVGVYAFWNDAGFKGDDLTLHAEAWPSDWLAITGRQRVALDPSQTLELQLSFINRPDKGFYGIGPNSLEGNLSRYTLEKLAGQAAYEWRFWRSSRIETMVGVRDVRVTDGHYANDPSLTAEVARGAYQTPFGFDQRYTAEYNRVVLALDTRPTEPRRGSGVRLELDAEQGSELRSTPLSGWIRYGATATGYADLTGQRRVLSLSVATEFADRLGSAQIPFTELVYLGGDHAMRGFFYGRLLGQSSAVATLRYLWPVAAWVDGDLQFALGNVFGEHLAGLDARLLRLSGAIGFSITGQERHGVLGGQDAPVEVLVGVGSETFDHGGQVDSVRVLLGVPHAF